MVSGRRWSLGAAIALSLALGGAIAAACYAVPQPECGFLCGPGGACPDGYACANDHACHRTGSPPELVCHTPDAAPGDDAAVDARLDAAIDAPDAPPDDAAIDAPDAAAR